MLLNGAAQIEETATLGKSDGKTSTQVVSIGEPTKVSQRRSLSTIS
jgi:hypothetical protein